MSLESAIGQAVAAVASTGTGTPTPAPATPAAPIVAAIPAAAVPPPATTPPAPQPSPAPAGITLSPEQWAAYSTQNARLAELEAAEQRRVAEAKDAEIKALQAKGHIEQAFALQRQQAEAAVETERRSRQQTEERARRYALDGELARALGSHPLVPGAAEDLTKLHREDFTVEAQGDSFVVRSKDFRPVNEYIASLLAKPEKAHWLRPQGSGGTAGGTNVQSVQTAPGIPALDAAPRNLSEYAMWAAKQKVATTGPAQATGGTIVNPDGSYQRVPAAGFGLRPLAKQA